MSSYRTMCLGLALVASVMLASQGCFQESPGNGAPVNNPDAGAVDSHPALNLDGGVVVDSHSSGSGCVELTIQYPPDFACSPEEIQAANEGPLPPNGSGPQDPPGDPSSIGLSASSCDALADLRRGVLRNAYHVALENQRREVLRKQCLGRQEKKYVDDQGQPRGPCYSGGYGGSSGAGGGSAGGSGGGAQEYSTTNNQVADVDEADYVKNNGEFVYVLSADGLHVIDAWPAPETHEVAHLTLTGEPRRLFLSGDRLVAYSYLATTSGDPSSGVPSSQGCTYGYSCRFTSEGGGTLVQVFDVTNPASPIVIARFEMSGGYVASRRVGTTIYTVVHDTGATVVPGINLTFSATNPTELEAQYLERIAAADQAIDSMAPTYFLPWVRQLDANGQVQSQITSCQQALLSQAAAGGSFVSLIAFSLEGAPTPVRSIVAAKPGFLYASASSLYLAVDGVDATDSVPQGYVSASNDRSTIHKFSLAGTDIGYVGSAAIRGHVLNQFSMDEYEGVLRVATSSGWVPDPDASSNITTIAQNAGVLGVVGEFTGLAPHEDIRAVRFDGDRGFVVTFKKTDPLFVIDLATPASPSVLGELMIPGFSTYMHRLDANHLLAVGFDADDQGDFAFFDGIQIQIFDVTSLSNPILLHKKVIGTRGSGSEALLNHLAFNYFPPKKMLALPITVCEGGGDGTFGDEMTFAGLMVFDISLTDGITEHGRMPFADPAAPSNYGTCGSWWTDATSQVKRSIFMDDYAFGLSETTMNVAALAELATVIKSVPLVDNP